MTPDYETAALKATEMLIKHNISSAPVATMPMLKKIPGVLVLSFAEASSNIGMDRDTLVHMCGNQDAVTSVHVNGSKVQYVVTYNQQLPFYILHRALARELGHIVLGHDGSLPEDIRNEEAKCFANHLLCPRPLIYSLKATGFRLTTEMVGNLTGCYDYCLSCMRRLPGINIPAELNRIVRNNFMPYILNFIDYHRNIMNKDGSALADLGTFMDGYEE